MKMMRRRRVYFGADLERLFADYLTDIACRVAEAGIALTEQSPLLVNVARPPLLAAMRETTVREKVSALRRHGIGPTSWTPHWFRHIVPALLLAGIPEWVVSRRLGHAHAQTTLDLYGWVREDEALRVAANWTSYASGWQVSEGPMSRGPSIFGWSVTPIRFGGCGRHCHRSGTVPSSAKASPPGRLSPKTTGHNSI
ncbi:hypothetical protein [Mycobacterium sp. SM1]|uniref:hypothetical protein n=1 Tax=Mycobacterium sp. SM1 TaxID=2816243 RepID=UPI001F36E4F1|nr:hypothetical protein [Mycobacterium sp. SM1]